MKFGYIQLNDTDNGREVPDVNSPQFKASLRILQRFGNIPVTGRMDAATIALINTDRCGVKDPQSNAAGRFNLQGTKWKKRVSYEGYFLLLHCASLLRREYHKLKSPPGVGLSSSKRINKISNKINKISPLPLPLPPPECKPLSGL